LISSPAASTAMTSVEIGIGHNLVTLNQTTNFTGRLAQPDEAVIDAAMHALTPASPAAPPTPPGPAAVHILTQTAASHIAAAVGPSLGSAWVPGSFPPAAPALVTYQPAGCAALAHEDYLNALPRPLARAEDRYKAAPDLANDGLETLSVRVESFPQPVPASMLTAASQTFRACPRYTVQTSESQLPGSNGPSSVTTLLSPSQAPAFRHGVRISSRTWSQAAPRPPGS
jgi:hypothetical protein